MKCPGCGASRTPINVATALEVVPAIAWWCGVCRVAEQPPYRRISDEVWEQLRLRAERGIQLYIPNSRRDPPSQAPKPKAPSCVNGHLRTEHGERRRDGDREYWICVTCRNEYRERTREQHNAQGRERYRKAKT